MEETIEEDEWGFPVTIKQGNSGNVNATSNAFNASNAFTTSTPTPPASYDCNSSRHWLDGLEEVDHMIDTFATLHPQARGRFTCWNQYQNGRGENMGGRLDYIYVDALLYNHLSVPVAGTLDCGLGDFKNKPWITSNQYGKKAAKEAGIGGWQDAPTGGGGLPDGRPKDYVWHTAVPPHSGMIYTPPQWSDHIGVSLLLKDLQIPDEHFIVMTKKEKNATRKCQPHASIRSITSFFGKSTSGGSSSSSSSSSSAVKKVDPPKKKKKKNLKNYFGGKN